MRREVIPHPPSPHTVMDILLSSMASCRRLYPIYWSSYALPHNSQCNVACVSCDARVNMRSTRSRRHFGRAMDNMLSQQNSFRGRSGNSSRRDQSANDIAVLGVCIHVPKQTAAEKKEEQPPQYYPLIRCRSQESPVLSESVRI